MSVTTNAPLQRASETIKVRISQLHGEIYAAEAEIRQRRRTLANPFFGGDKTHLPAEIVGLNQLISEKEALIRSQESRLEEALQREALLDRIQANLDAKEAEAARLKEEQRLDNAKAAAREEYLAAGGALANFERVWPVMLQQIATEAATEAATVSLASNAPNQSKVIDYAQKVLTTLYGGVKRPADVKEVK